ncbi:MAG: hypothetical protein GTO45_17355 [Candidatus Aminicenantes bacterium]|nr:hypothetical protein [Candidatus Aminicenantes bacterium]NIM78478.1 hypothetical protein [Candidatus Aminicenantes bacterium]NIN19899.1 hypothetical protein [Candidatus Aminicenantes bacterium]NIN41616.1 hypothetical protein [Candidatus Aminicenantes bacterium]NIN86525.1 hypothetical protein [Candidatus Aminicenantes bacterium]
MKMSQSIPIFIPHMLKEVNKNTTQKISFFEIKPLEESLVLELTVHNRESIYQTITTE